MPLVVPDLTGSEPFDGKYAVEERLGTGGMGTVYRARTSDGKTVAIKVLHPALAMYPEVQVRFRRESYIANQIEHPGAVPVIDDGTTVDGRAYLVMPLLEGTTLREHLASTSRALPIAEAVSFVIFLLDVLVAAHAKKIIHRDIKPENLFLTSNGELKVLDFGIARVIDAEDSASLTRSGHVLGTPAFMSPEQALGRDIDERSDLWSVGATLFTLLSGRFVHNASNGSEALIYAATRKVKPAREEIPTLSSALAAILDRALAFDKSERFSSAGEMREALLQSRGDKHSARTDSSLDGNLLLHDQKTVLPARSANVLPLVVTIPSSHRAATEQARPSVAPSHCLSVSSLFAGKTPPWWPFRVCYEPSNSSVSKLGTSLSSWSSFPRVFRPRTRKHKSP